MLLWLTLDQKSSHVSRVLPSLSLASHEDVIVSSVEGYISGVKLILMWKKHGVSWEPIKNHRLKKWTVLWFCVLWLMGSLNHLFTWQTAWQDQRAEKKFCFRWHVIIIVGISVKILFPPTILPPRFCRSVPPAHLGVHSPKRAQISTDTKRIISNDLYFRGPIRNTNWQSR